MNLPPCANNPKLFESNDPRDHAEARAICLGCDRRDWCQRLLDQTVREFGYGGGFGPQGTWAGRLLGRANAAECGTRGGYDRHLRLGEPTCDKCREANRVRVAATAAKSRGEVA